MIATHSLSKPLNVFTPQAHKPTILNLHPNNATILSSSISGGNWRMLRQEMHLRDHLQPTETMGLSGPDPEAVASKRPITRMCMCQNKRVPSWRSLTLESLKGGTAPSAVLLVAKKARLNPHLLDDAECKFKEILSHKLVEFEDLQECAWRIEMSRKEDAAVKELECYIKKSPESSQELHEAQMLLVEMLIYQGDYERARQTWDRARQNWERERQGLTNPVMDYRLQLYPAVIYVLLGNAVEARKHWDAFNEMSEGGFGASPPHVDESIESPPHEDESIKIKSPPHEDESIKIKSPPHEDESIKSPPHEDESIKIKSPPHEDESIKSPPHEDESTKTPMAEPEKFSKFKEHVEVLGQEIIAVRYN